MEDSNHTVQLLTEIRDLLASDEPRYEEYLARDSQRYEEYLAKTEQVTKDQFDQARKRALLARPFQWLTLGVVVYIAVLCALRSVN